MNKNKSKNILITAKRAVDEYCDWLWHEDLTDIEKLDEIFKKSFWLKEADFGYLALEILKYIEVIDESCRGKTETIQYRTNIWSDEDEFLQNGGDENFDSYREYLDYQTMCAFEDLHDILVKELFVAHDTHFKGGIL